MSHAVRPAFDGPAHTRLTKQPLQKIPLSCQQCGKEYQLDPKFLEGRKSARFQCTRCGSIFEKTFVKEPDREVIERLQRKQEKKEERAATSGPPVADVVESSEEKGTLIRIISLAALIIGISAAAFFVLNSSGHSAEEVYPLSVSHEKVTLEDGAQEARYTFTGSVRNGLERTLRNIEVEIQLFVNDTDLLSSHRVRLTPSLTTAGSSNVALTAAALSRAAREVSFAPGEDFTFSIPIIMSSEAKPTSFTVHATGSR